MRPLRLFLIATLLFQTGAHLVVLQTAAWARMALRRDVRSSCELCLRVQTDAQSHKKQEAKTTNRRIDLHLAAARPLPAAFSPLWTLPSTTASSQDARDVADPPPPKTLSA